MSKKIYEHLPDNQFKAKFGPIFYQGTVLNMIFAGIIYLGGFAGFLYIRSLFGSTNQGQDGSSGGNSKGANYPAVGPTVLTHSTLNTLPLIDHTNWQLMWKFIGIEDIAILYCEPGVGKSVLAHQIAYEIANGQQSLAAPANEGTHEPQIVLYYDAEMTVNDYKRRYPFFTAPDNMNLLMNFYFSDSSAWIEDLKKHIGEANGDVFVVLDNITSAFKNMTAEEMRFFLTVQLRNCQKQVEAKGFHLTFLIIAHTTKEGILGGVANLQNFGTSILHLKKIDDQHNELVVDKSRNYGEIADHHYILQKSEDGYKHFEYDGELVAGASGGQTADESPVQPGKPKEKGVRKYPPLSEEMAAEIRAKRAAGKRDATIARELKIKQSYIARCLKRFPEAKDCSETPEANPEEESHE